MPNPFILMELDVIYQKKIKMKHKKSGNKNPNWKGGVSKPKCRICDKKITYKAKCCNKCRNRVADKNPKWRGGRCIDYEGYIYIYTPHHPFSTKDGYVKEHRLVIEKKLKRFLTKEEVVHHKNGIKHDNRLRNLHLFESASAHAKHHYKERGGYYGIKGNKPRRSKTIKN